MKTAYIDIQTNSNNLKIASVIAFSIAVVQDEEELVFLQSLVKPQAVLTARQEANCGYENRNLRNAPALVDLLPEIIDALEGSVVRYFGMFSAKVWRKVFREVGFPLGASNSCFTNLVSKNTSSAEKMSFEQFANQLAIPFDGSNLGSNARALCNLFRIQALDVNVLDSAFTKEKKTISTTDELHSHLPNSPGIYYFRNADNEVIYVGKAVAIKKRVLSHFRSKAKFETILCRATASIEFSETGNELIALLKESAEIKKLQPIYNTQQIEENLQWIIVDKLDAKNVLRLQPVEKNYSDTYHTISFNRNSVIQKLKVLQVLHNLCPRFIGVARTSGSCTSKQCNGICRGEEDKKIYNYRVREAISTINKEKESYYFNLPGRKCNERSFVLVVDGIFLGYGFINDSDIINSLKDIESYLIPQEHTYYTSRSISTYLSKRGVERVLL